MARYTGFILMSALAVLACNPDGVGGPKDAGTTNVAEIPPLRSVVNCQDTLALVIQTDTDPEGLLADKVSSFASIFNSAFLNNPELSSADRDQLQFAKVYFDAVPPTGSHREQVRISLGTPYGDPNNGYDGWCGNAGVQIWQCDSGGNGTPFPHAEMTLFHEVLQHVGINETWSSDETNGCALHPDSPIPQGSTPCEHDRQFYYEHCGLRGTDTYSQPDINASLSSPSLTIVGPDNIVRGSSEQYQSKLDGTPIATYWASTGQISVDPSLASTKTAQAAATTGPGSLEVTLKRDDVTYPWPKTMKSVPVVDPPVAFVEVSPASVTLSASEVEEDLVAVAYAADSTVVSPQFTWQSSNPAVVIYGSGGSVTVRGCRDYPLPASGTVTVTADGQSDSMTVLVMKNYPYYC